MQPRHASCSSTVVRCWKERNGIVMRTNRRPRSNARMSPETSFTHERTDFGSRAIFSRHTASIASESSRPTISIPLRAVGMRILPAKSQDYVPRFGSLLGLSERVQVRAVHVLDSASQYDVTSGKGPIGVAAAALYIAAVLEGEKKTQREVADAIGVTEVTIRNRYKEIIEKLGIKEEVEEKVKEEEEEEQKK